MTRTRAATVALAITVAASSTLPGLAAPDTVTVEGGAVSGTTEGGGGLRLKPEPTVPEPTVPEPTVRAFKGIPYAAPPVGPGRWRPPQPVAAWSGVRDGSEYGAECPQTQYGEGSVYVRPLRPQSEDCLFLNVWTTARAGDRRPVFVWIHGGALTRGSSTSDVRDGTPMARKGPVVVSINYRLGALGYLAHPSLTAESATHSSGNYGVLDQIAALTWVRQNIAAFGGDPARVTIGGESAGSWSVNTLVASPLAKGLFVRAIGESGGRFTNGPYLHDDRNNVTSAEAVGLAFAKSAGAETLAALRAMPAEQIISAGSFRTQENVDGWVLPDQVKTLFAEKRHNNVPVIVGSNLNEMTSLGGAGLVPKSFEDYRTRIQRQFGESAQAFDAAYGVKGPADVERATLALGRNTVFSLHMRRWAQLTTAAGSNAFLYLFSHVPPSPRRAELGAFHASELPYVFNVLTGGDPREAGFAYTPADHQLADQMSTYWANFVMTGDPNGRSLPKWTAYDTVTEPHMEFASPIKSGTHLFKAELDFLEPFQR